MNSPARVFASLWSFAFQAFIVCVAFGVTLQVVTQLIRFWALKRLFQLKTPKSFGESAKNHSWVYYSRICMRLSCHALLYQLGEERIIWFTGYRPSLRKDKTGIHGRKSGNRDWNIDQGRVLLTGFVSITFSGFYCKTQPICPEMALLTMGWALLCQPLIK